MLIVPNMRPSQDSVVHRGEECRDTYPVQEACHECCLEPVHTCAQNKKVLQGAPEEVLKDMQLKEVPEEALESILGEGLKEAPKEVDLQEGNEQTPG